MRSPLSLSSPEAISTATPTRAARPRSSGSAPIAEPAGGVGATTGGGATSAATGAGGGAVTGSTQPGAGDCIAAAAPATAAVEPAQTAARDAPVASTLNDTSGSGEELGRKGAANAACAERKAAAPAISALLRIRRAMLISRSNPYGGTIHQSGVTQNWGDGCEEKASAVVSVGHRE